VLTDYHDEALGYAWPSVPRLARECLCSERTIQAAAQRLATDRLLEIDRQPHRTNRYRILVSQRTIDFGGSGGVEGAVIAPPQILQGASAIAAQGAAAAAPEPSVSRQKPNPPVVPPETGGTPSDDELLRDEKNYAILSWRGGHIVIRTGRRRRVFTRNETESLQGASLQDVIARLRRKGFWAKVYEPRSERGEPPPRAHPEEAALFLESRETVN